MKIGLIELDNTDFPNIALMKISSYHKDLGDDVEWYDPMFGGWYDIVYVSKVFSYSDDYPYEINADTVIYGGGGYSKEQLYLDTVMPDYSLYGIENEAYGYLTRGCPNNCPYCVVPKLDGNSVRKVADLGDFWSGQKTINIMDANLLGLNNRLEVVDLFEQMIKSKAYINFVQGLDIRLVDDEIIDLLLRMKIKIIHFAWDDPRDKIIPQKLQHFRDRTGWGRHKVVVYVLTNFWSTKDEDLERIYTIRDMGFSPFDMVYDRHLLPRGHEVLRMQRWCNNNFVFRSVDRYEDYR
jgi:hypothetical protein